MGVLDALRTWSERNTEATGDDWRVAQGQGWARNLDESDGRRMAEERSQRQEQTRIDRRNQREDIRNRMDNTTTAQRVAEIHRDRFIETRPKGDRLVYVLLGQLTRLNAEAGRVGHEWYEAHRNDLTTQQGSDWILRIRAKIAEAQAGPPVELVNEVRSEPVARTAWREWRELAAQLVEFGGRTGARFAIDTEAGASNDLAFWWIVPGRDAHEGKFWLRQVIGGQGDVRVRMSPEAMVAIARKIIAADPKEAMIRYGREIGECGHCGRTLTNEASRHAGIGPVCARGKGW